MGILSIQSHVVFGYVGNKAAVYPLQSMGYDVWPANTVQFSNHTGYGKWRGEVFQPEHITDVIRGLEDIGVLHECEAVLSGYMGSAAICNAVADTVQYLKNTYSDVLYLCDPVIGGTSCYVKPEVLDFFKTKLHADIITPNHFEAEILSDIKIIDVNSLKIAAKYFHDLGIKIVVVTGLKLPEFSSTKIQIFVSDQISCYIVTTSEYDFPMSISGTGDLFSATYLGSYLSTKDTCLALRTAAYHMEQVMAKTFEVNSNELQVTKIHYDSKIDDQLLPNYVVIDLLKD
jgi:pyridoxine kinase